MSRLPAPVRRAFLKEENRGLYEPARLEIAGRRAERSSKNNRAVTAAIPYFQDWRRGGPPDQGVRHRQSRQAARPVRAQHRRPGASRCFTPRTAEEANRLVLEIARQHDVKTVVKSKSMVTEEMELNHVLEVAGRPAGRDRPGRIPGAAWPASGRSTSSRRPCTCRPPTSASCSRKSSASPIRAEHAPDGHCPQASAARFLSAGMGISGCNFAVADTGTIGVVENEGNAGLSTATPPVHVVLDGHREGHPRDRSICRCSSNLLARSGTGQKLTTYTHLIHGPAPGQKTVRDHPGQRPDEDPAGPGRLAVAVLHPLRGLPERLPGLPPRGRLVLRLGLSGSDRLGHHAAPGGHGEGGQAALRLVALRGLRRGLPGEDRHSRTNWSISAIARSTSRRR